LLSAILGTFVVKSTRKNIEYKEIEIEYNTLMFTLDQIKEAHASVKSGADFPRYIQNLIILGVQKYDIFVHDGHGEYFGADTEKLVSPPEYAILTVAGKRDEELFTKKLKAHQKGQTNYITFCQDAANAGVAKWTVDTATMECTYYDKYGNIVFEENLKPKKLSRAGII
jgi:uncharacterized protein YbcV (DUF1398 family)